MQGSVPVVEDLHEVDEQVDAVQVDAQHEPLFEAHHFGMNPEPKKNWTELDGHGRKFTAARGAVYGRTLDQARLTRGEDDAPAAARVEAARVAARAAARATYVPMLTGVETMLVLTLEPPPVVYKLRAPAGSWLAAARRQFDYTPCVSLLKHLKVHGGAIK